jgi:hypothetical protein
MPGLRRTSQISIKHHSQPEGINKRPAQRQESRIFIPAGLIVS